MTLDLVVVGVGYVGLPLARHACAAGLAVVGYDISASVVAGLADGRSHVDDVSDAEVRAILAEGFLPTTDPKWIGQADTVVLCVPTGLDSAGRPDLGPLKSACAVVAEYLRPGMLVVLESTSFPGTTDEVVRPILERGGLVAGQDFALAYSPERIDPGNRDYGVRNTPKVVSGYTPVCAKQCAAFYGRFVDSTVITSGLREAELAKLLENTYRYVNIALVNELALYCHELGVDVWEVLRCAATKPFGYQAFRPGPGVGGHCIPIDPRYLAVRACADGFTFTMIEAAHRVNAGMPGRVADRVVELLRAEGRNRVLLLGVTYKADVADVRESPAIILAERLLADGVAVFYHDPYVPSFPEFGARVPRRTDLSAGLAATDLVVLLQAHRCYATGCLGARVPRLLDTTGTVSGEHVIRL